MVDRVQYRKGFCSAKCMKEKQASGDIESSKALQKLKYEVLRTQGRKCRDCGTEKGKMEVVHIQGVDKFPELALEISNLKVVCEPCSKCQSLWLFDTHLK